MPAAYETDLYRRLRTHLDTIRIVDCHEHMTRDRQLPDEHGTTIGRLFCHYTPSDLASAGMPPADQARVLDSKNGLSPRERWKLLEPWYRKAWNTGYCECVRIALQDLFGVEDFSDATVGPITEALEARVKPGYTRQVFDRAGIDFAMNNIWAPRQVCNLDQEPDLFQPDMLDNFTDLDVGALQRDSGLDILCLDDFLRVIDWYFETYARVAGAFKVGLAYNRTLTFEDVPRDAVEKTFLRLLAFADRPDRRDLQALQDFLIHTLCRQCGEYGLRMKFHTGLQSGSGNIIMNSRAAKLANLFMKYPKTNFDIYHISYPYQDEVVTLAKNFPNVTADFCWMWVINPAAGRRALSEMLDAVPANKIHGFGGDYRIVEAAYGHAMIAKREIARVLAEKVEEGRFTEDYAAEVGRRLLRDNAMENFGLKARRAAFKKAAKGKK